MKTLKQKLTAAFGGGWTVGEYGESVSRGSMYSLPFEYVDIFDGGYCASLITAKMQTHAHDIKTRADAVKAVRAMGAAADAYAKAMGATND